MRPYFISILLLLQINLFAQDCVVDPFIVGNYEYDAELLAVHEIQSDSNHIFSDSVFVPLELKNKYLGVLTTIYKNGDRYLVDSLFNLQKIHVANEKSTISIQVSPTIKWVETFVENGSYSGNADFDSILKTYSFTLSSTSSFGSYFYLFIKSPVTLNLLPVISQIQNIEGVVFAEFFGFSVVIDPMGCEDEESIPNDIFFTRTEDADFITFQKSMGACPDNCFKSRFWKFQLLDECNVDFIGGFCQRYDGFKDLQNRELIIARPNPFESTIEISTIFSTSEITIANLSGEVVYTFRGATNRIDLDKLEKGIYIITAKNGSDVFTQKLMKR